MNKKRYLIFILLLFCGNLLLAQAPAWAGGADQNDISFGFKFSYISSNFKIDKKPGWRAPFYDQLNKQYITDTLNSIGSNPLPGFSVGFITRYRITDHLEVRTTPGLIFTDRSINYGYLNPSQNVTKQVNSTAVEFPLALKLKSDRIGDLRAYILGGVKYTMAIGKNANDTGLAPLDKTVKNIGGFGSYEAGFGFDIYFEFFKLSPEIKLSNSFGNVMLPENHAFSSPISKLSLHTIMFSLYFE